MHLDLLLVIFTMFRLLILLAFMSSLHIKDVRFIFVVLQIFCLLIHFLIHFMTHFWQRHIKVLFCQVNQFITFFFSVPSFSSLYRGEDLLLALLHALSVTSAGFLLLALCGTPCAG